MYRVKEFFNDLQDRKETKAGPIFHAYYPGDEYPRAGYKPSAEDLGPEAQMEEPKAPAEKKPRRRTAKKAQ